jgi:hypothetical protein
MAGGFLAGLSAFAPGYIKGREDAARMQGQQLAMRQIQAQNRQNQLAGQAVLAGGIPGLEGPAGGGGNIFGMPQAPGPQQGGAPGGMPGQPAGPAPQPPMPGQSSAPQQPQSPLPQPSPQQFTRMSPQQMVQGEAAREPFAGGQHISVSGAPGDQGGMADPGAPQRPQPQQPQQQPQQQSQGGNPGTTVTLRNGMTMDVSQFYHHVDFSAVARRIKQVAPDASPEDIWGATQQIYKMAQGDRSDQQQAALLTKLLMQDTNITAVDNRQGNQIAAAGERQVIGLNAVSGRQADAIGAREREQATAINAANQRAYEARNAAMERLMLRLAQSPDPATKQKLLSLKAQRQTLNDQIRNVVQNPSAGDSTKLYAALAQIDKQIEALAEPQQPGTTPDAGAAPSQ